MCKPATMVALVVAAVSLDPAPGADARQRWFVAALVLSLAGDVFLMLPREEFVAGLSAFLLAHVCFLAGLWTHGPAALPFAVSVVVVAVAIGVIGSRVLPGARRHDPALVVPVGAYMLVIGAMLATALAVGNPLAAVGATLFVGSDSLIAWDRFVGEIRGAPVMIMITYHLGQAALVASLLR